MRTPVILAGSLLQADCRLVDHRQYRPLRRDLAGTLWWQFSERRPHWSAWTVFNPILPRIMRSPLAPKRLGPLLCMEGFVYRPVFAISSTVSRPFTAFASAANYSQTDCRTSLAALPISDPGHVTLLGAIFTCLITCTPSGFYDANPGPASSRGPAFDVRQYHGHRRCSLLLHHCPYPAHSNSPVLPRPSSGVACSFSFAKRIPAYLPAFVAGPTVCGGIQHWHTPDDFTHQGAIRLRYVFPPR